MKEFYDEDPQAAQQREESLRKRAAAPVDFNNLKREELREFRQDSQRLAPEYRYKYGENFFRDINPYGWPLEKIRDQLAEELAELKMDLISLCPDSDKIEKLSEKEENIFRRLTGTIAEKTVWLNYLDDYFAKQGSESFEDIEEYITDKWDNLAKGAPERN